MMTTADKVVETLTVHNAQGRLPAVGQSLYVETNKYDTSGEKVTKTYSSFIALVYIYLIVLQDWTNAENDRSEIMKFKWMVIVAGVLDFGLGILLAFAANMHGIPSKLRILIWIISETFLVPISIFLLMQLYKRLNSSVEYETDTHYSRVNVAQICFLLAQYIFIAYAIDFLVQGQRKTKSYDPSIRPKSVYAPTDPQITTTESRHIRMSQSLLFQPSSSRALSKNTEKEGILDDLVKSEEFGSYFYEKREEAKPGSAIPRTRKNLEAGTKTESLLFKNKKKIDIRVKVREQSKEESKDEGLKEEKSELVQHEDKEKESAKDQEKEWTEDEKEWRRDENYWMTDEAEVVNKDRDSKERLEWVESERKSEEAKVKDTLNESDEKFRD